MRSEAATLSAHGDAYEAELTVPDDPDGRGIAVMPGAGHGPWGGIFDRLAEAAAADGSHVFRFESWTPSGVWEKSLDDLHAELDAAVRVLQDRGCTDLAVVGKSFGAGVMLTHVPDAVDRLVLWAPAAFDFGEESHIGGVSAAPIEELDSRQIGPGTLADVDAAALLIHGSEDAVVPVENSRRVVDALADAELLVREGEDHSFRGVDLEREVVDQTLAFLRD
ncbi:alpha/beta hydrolase [Halobacterium wangiae]|uniref:alpha/beta hydrolase n=1 Tax=Halobacterium wangiae TaxID=2902623 RepID=UPI001E35792C|nr:prolyl oligopeptidase family serine peptidase [Halobacterium wangiae]